MRDHATVAATFWTRGTGKLLRGHLEAQLVAMYLMTCPGASMAGIFHLGLPTLCHETGLSLEGASKGLARCFEVGFCEYDEAEELVWVPNLARYQVGSAVKPNDNRKAGIVRALRPFERHDFYSKFMELYADAYGLDAIVVPAPKVLPSKAFESPKPEAPSKPLRRGHVLDPDPVLDLGHDPESVTGKRTPPPLKLEPTAPAKLAPAEEVHAHFDVVNKRHRPGARGTKLLDADRKAIAAKLKAGIAVDDIKLAIEGLFLSPHHLGENTDGTKYLTLNHALRDHNFDKFVELAIEARPRAPKREEHDPLAAPAGKPCSPEELEAKMAAFRKRTGSTILDDILDADRKQGADVRANLAGGAR